MAASSTERTARAEESGFLRAVQEAANTNAAGGRGQRATKGTRRAHVSAAQGGVERRWAGVVQKSRVCMMRMRWGRGRGVKNAHNGCSSKEVERGAKTEEQSSPGLYLAKAKKEGEIKGRREREGGRCAVGVQGIIPSAAYIAAALVFGMCFFVETAHNAQTGVSQPACHRRHHDHRLSSSSVCRLSVVIMVRAGRSPAGRRGMSR